MSARLAQQTMIAGAVALVMTSTSDPSWISYLACVRDALPEAEDCGPTMVPVWVACDSLTRARSGEDRTKALYRLSYEVRVYFLRSMADRHAELTGKSGAAA